MNVALIGPRGAGKSTVSRLLSVATGWPVLSTDTLVSYETEGSRIPQIIADSGGSFARFRELEYHVLSKAGRLHEVILDCGGGIVVDLGERGEEQLSERKVSLLKEHALVFFLLPRLEDVANKIAGDEQRPSLGSASPSEIHERRLPWYRRAAHYEIEVRGDEEDRSVEVVRKAMSEAGIL